MKTSIAFKITIGIIIIISIQTSAAYLMLIYIDNWTNRGIFGDMFGVVNALFAGLAFCGLLITIWQQREDISLQREELELTRKELKKSAEAQKDLAELNKQQSINEYRAYIFAQVTHSNGYVYISVKNIGKSMAENLKLSIGNKSPIEVSFPNGYKSINEIEFFPKCISTLAPGAKIVRAIDSIQYFLSKYTEKNSELKINVQYNSLNNLYEEYQTLNVVQQIIFTQSTNDNTQTQLARSVDKIAEALSGDGSYNRNITGRITNLNKTLNKVLSESNHEKKDDQAE